LKQKLLEWLITNQRTKNMNTTRIPKFIILSLSVVVAWISYEIFLSSTTSSIPKEDLKMAERIDTYINEEMLEGLNEKTLYNTKFFK